MLRANTYNTGAVVSGWGNHIALGQPALSERFIIQYANHVQEGKRNALLTELSCLRYLLRHGLAIRGHNDDQHGNLKQLLVMMANPLVKDWIRENKYMSLRL